MKKASLSSYVHKFVGNFTLFPDRSLRLVKIPYHQHVHLLLNI
jgi:hypothetical protein